KVCATHHIGDSLLEVVDDRGELVSKQPVRTLHHEIADLVRQVLLEPALKAVVEPDHRVADPQPDRAREAAGTDAVAAGPGIDALILASQRGIGYFAAGTRAGKDVSVFLEVSERSRVAPGPRALPDHGPVPLESVILEDAKNRVCCATFFPRPVEVLHAHQPLAPDRARFQVAADGGDQRAEMQRTGGRGREAPPIEEGRVMHNSASKIISDKR